MTADTDGSGGDADMYACKWYYRNLNYRTGAMPGPINNQAMSVAYHQRAILSFPQGLAGLHSSRCESTEWTTDVSVD